MVYQDFKTFNPSINNQIQQYKKQLIKEIVLKDPLQIHKHYKRKDHLMLVIIITIIRMLKEMQQKIQTLLIILITVLITKLLIQQVFLPNKVKLLIRILKIKIKILKLKVEIIRQIFRKKILIVLTKNCKKLIMIKKKKNFNLIVKKIKNIIK